MIKNKTYDIEKLKILFDQSIIKFSQKKRFIHPKTVENFIFHFYSFKDKKRKDHIYNNLNGYFYALSNLEFDDLTPKTSVSLFDQFIAPIINYYDVYRSFSVHIKWPFFLLIVVALLGIVTVANIAFYYKVGLVLVLSIIFIRNRFKEKLHKTYGVFH